MKKAAVIVLMGIYSIACVGFSVNSFYCCGKLQAVTVSLSEQKNTHCAAGETSSCCKIKHQTLKVKDSHTGSSADFHGHDFSGNWLLTGSEFEIPLFADPIEYGANTAHGPPLITSCPLYIFHCDYRI